MNLGPYRLIAHLRPDHPGEWDRGPDDGDDRPARILVCWDGPTGAAWQATARRLRLLAQLKHGAVNPLMHLALDHEHPHAVWAAPPAVSLQREFDDHVKW